jgi:hypothetical protein
VDQAIIFRVEIVKVLCAAGGGKDQHDTDSHAKTPTFRPAKILVITDLDYMKGCQLHAHKKLRTIG